MLKLLVAIGALCVVSAISMIAVGGMLCLDRQPLRSALRRPERGMWLSRPEAELYNALNRYRAQHGRGPLRIDPNLMAAARGRTNARYPTGHRVNGQNPMSAARSAGYRKPSVGENLAWGNNPTRTVNPQWAHSRGHNRNQLGNWHDVGVAVGNGRNGTARVAMFGR